MTTDHLDLPQELGAQLGAMGKKAEADNDSQLETEVDGLRKQQRHIAYGASALVQQAEDKILDLEAEIDERAKQREEIRERAERMLEPVDVSDEPDEEPEPVVITTPEPTPPIRVVVEPEAPVPPIRRRPVEEIPTGEFDDNWVTDPLTNPDGYPPPTRPIRVIDDEHDFRAPERIAWDNQHDTAMPEQPPRRRSVYNPRHWRCLLPWTMAALGLFIGLLVGDHTYTLARGDLRTGWFTLVWILAVMGFGFFLLGGLGERHCRRHHYHEER